MRAFNVWIAEDLHRALMLRRVERGMSVNEMVREALAEWLRRQPRRRKGVR
jgi:predicted HicB family RNase H-like nuclease